MDIKNKFEFFKNIKLTEDGYLIVSGSGGTPEEVEITINGDTYKSVEAPNTEDIIVKDEDGNIVGSLIGGEWIVPSGGSKPIGTPLYFPLTNTSVNPVYQNTGNTGQSINGHTYTFIPNAGLHFHSIPTNFNNLLRNSTINDPDISNWDVSNITRMDNMFASGSFNQDISSWNVSNVTTMTSMFFGTSFNQDIGNWNVSNVTAMNNMFMNTLNFNQDIGLWNVSSATNMVAMFRNASNFNQDLSGWCVTNITTEPTDFSVGSALTPENKPVWGTCP